MPRHHEQHPHSKFFHLFASVQALVLLACDLTPVLGGGAATRFDFGTLTVNSLKLLGDAHLVNGSIQLSRDLPVPNSGAGRALYAHPVKFRHPTTRIPFSFSTFFSFSVLNLNPSSIGGGLAFVIASDDHSIGDAGGFLGLVNGSNAIDGDAMVVAAEFDTLMDVEFSDINGNHVGVDLNSLVSTKVADLDFSGVDLKSGHVINAWVEYDGTGKIFQVYVSYSAVRPSEPVISFSIDLGRFVNDHMFVGFSGSTQGSTEVHSIKWWSFASAGSSVPIKGGGSDGDGSPSSVQRPPDTVGNSSSLGNPTAPSTAPTMLVTSADGPKGEGSGGSKISSCENNELCRQGPGAVAGVASAGAFFAAGFAGLVLWVFSRRSKSIEKSDDFAIDIIRSPREFTFRELCTATRGFDPSRIIGHGAFGTVYKGIVADTGAIIAVKRCINGEGNGGQGRAEFLSELSIIAGLRHRNLVRLQGWCHEKGEILLVYDYMPNGSLDKALFEPTTKTSTAEPLSWLLRKRILTGVASALAYLHRECERQVIHRDVKSSNIMLDEDFHARLGDFGLARQVEHDKSPDATATAGTMGYLAPEYLLTGLATEKSDVFSFGAVVLEVVCGRRPIENASAVAAPGSIAAASLVERVWGLHGQGRLMEAVDRRLAGDYNEADVRRVMLVGLACSQPDPAARPWMRTVVQMLSGETEPPVVPVTKPSMSLSTTQQLIMSLQDSVSDYNGLAMTLSAPSTSASVNGGGDSGEGRPQLGIAVLH